MPKLDRLTQPAKADWTTMADLHSMNSKQEHGNRREAGKAQPLKEVIGHDKDWLEPTRSKMAENMTSFSLMISSL